MQLKNSSVNVLGIKNLFQFDNLPCFFYQECFDLKLPWQAFSASKALEMINNEAEAWVESASSVLVTQYDGCNLWC